MRADWSRPIWAMFSLVWSFVLRIFRPCGVSLVTSVKVGIVYSSSVEGSVHV